MIVVLRFNGVSALGLFSLLSTPLNPRKYTMEMIKMTTRSSNSEKALLVLEGENMLGLFITC
jgi:hypothetical protein